MIESNLKENKWINVAEIKLMELVGTLEEVKKEADKAARLLFSPEDQVAVSREGETIYFGRP